MLHLYAAFLLASGGCCFAGAANSPSLEDTGVQELATAAELATTWGIGSTSGFFSVAEAGNSLEDVLQAPGTSSIIVALLDETKPRRRNASINEPFLRLDGPGLSQWGAELLFVDQINSAAWVLEAYLGRQLYPFKLVLSDRSPAALPNSRPWAVWNTSSGAVHLNPRVLDAASKLSFGGSQAVSDFTEALFQQIGQLSLQGDKGWAQVFKAAAPAAVMIAFAAKIPVWFCIACPVLLGLLAPFLLNAGLGAAAEMICQHYALPSEECNDLWYGAFALALVLSLASVIPIVAVCRLRECAKQG